MKIACCLVMFSTGCYSSMIEESLGGVTSSHAGRSGGALAIHLAAGEDPGPAIGVGANVIVTEKLGLITDAAELAVIGVMHGGIRGFARVGLGFNLGWIDGRFGGGGLGTASVGVILGKKHCGLAIDTGVMWVGRIGDAPGEPLFGVHFGPGCASHRNDP